MHVVPAFVCAVIGFVCGAIGQIQIKRSPIRERMRAQKLHCMNCGDAITLGQSISFLAIARRDNACGTCGACIWTRWPWVEVGMALVMALVAGRFGWAVALPAYLIFFAALFVITIIDLRNYVIPNRIVYPALFSCLAILCLAGVFGNSHAHTRLLMALAGMTGAWLFFFVSWLVSPRGMGLGDVRLSALIGLLAGWISLGTVVIAVVLGLLLGASTGILLMAMRLRGRRDAIPFGPFLAAGAIIGVMWGGNISDWWLGR